MNKLSLLLFTILILLSACGQHRVQGEGDVITKQNEISGFKGVHIYAPVKVNIAVGSANTSCVFKGQENIINHLVAKMNGAVLEITTDIKNISFNTDEPIEVNISLPTLERLKMAGSSEAFVTGNLIGNEFFLTISGSGDASIQNIQVHDFKADISGSGNVNIASGRAENIDYVVSGAGDINAYGLVGKVIDASVSGAGDIELSAETSLTGAVSGAGNISYKGNPKVESHISGAGRVESAK